MPDGIGINLSTQPFCNDVDVLVLAIFCHAGNERDPNRGCEQQADASKELSRCVVAVSSGVVIDNVAEDDGIQEGKDLVDRRQHQDQYNEKPVLSEVSEKNSHRDQLTRLTVAAVYSLRLRATALALRGPPGCS